MERWWTLPVRACHGAPMARKSSPMKLVALISMLALAVPAFADSATDVLDTYLKVSSALVADDFGAASKANEELISKAKAAGAESVAAKAEAFKGTVTLKAAREAFKGLSKEIIGLAKGKEGYFVASCPMSNADWLQNKKEITNPYGGKAMPDCGFIKQ